MRLWGVGGKSIRLGRLLSTGGASVGAEDGLGLGSGMGRSARPDLGTGLGVLGPVGYRRSTGIGACGILPFVTLGCLVLSEKSAAV